MAVPCRFVLHGTARPVQAAVPPVVLFVFQLFHLNNLPVYVDYSDFVAIHSTLAGGISMFVIAGRHGMITHSCLLSCAFCGVDKWTTPPYSLL